MVSSVIAEGQFKTMAKCSAHVQKFSSLVINVFPSALSRGDEPDDVGRYTPFKAPQD